MILEPNISQSHECLIKDLWALDDGFREMTINDV